MIDLTSRALPTRRGPIEQAIGTDVVRLHRKVTGRGPTRANTHIEDEVIVVVLEDMLTAAERSLLRRGNEDSVRLLRDDLHEIMRAQLIEVVETHTGWSVRACLTATHFGPDYLIETFVVDKPQSA